jgi:hypothetical protein
MTEKEDILQEVIHDIEEEISRCAAFNGIIPEERCEGPSCEYSPICEKVRLEQQKYKDLAKQVSEAKEVKK